MQEDTLMHKGKTVAICKVPREQNQRPLWLKGKDAEDTGKQVNKDMIVFVKQLTAMC